VSIHCRAALVPGRLRRPRGGEGVGTTVNCTLTCFARAIPAPHPTSLSSRLRSLPGRYLCAHPRPRRSNPQLFHALPAQTAGPPPRMDVQGHSCIAPSRRARPRNTRARHAPQPAHQKKTMETGSSQHDHRAARLDLENDRLLPAPCICMICPAVLQAATRSTAQPKPRHKPRSAAPAAAAAGETGSSERAAPSGTWSRGCSNVRATEAQA